MKGTANKENWKETTKSMIGWIGSKKMIAKEYKLINRPNCLTMNQLSLI